LNFVVLVTSVGSRLCMGKQKGWGRTRVCVENPG